jgi:glucose-6-phosphate 1-dehydrogenase
MTSILTNPLRVGLRQERVIPPQCLVIFGASGDLTHRKLVPALFELFRQRRLPSEFSMRPPPLERRGLPPEDG